MVAVLKFRLRPLWLAGEEVRRGGGGTCTKLPPNFFLKLRCRAKIKKLCFHAKDRVRCFFNDWVGLCDLQCLFTLENILLHFYHNIYFSFPLLRHSPPWYSFSVTFLFLYALIGGMLWLLFCLKTFEGEKIIYLHFFISIIGIWTKV